MHTKFGANRSINDRDIAVLYFQDGDRQPSRILEKWELGATVTLAWPISICTPNLGANRSING